MVSHLYINGQLPATKVIINDRFVAAAVEKKKNPLADC